MKIHLSIRLLCIAILAIALFQCSGQQQPEGAVVSEATAAAKGGQSMVKDDVSQKNIVGVAAASPDHTTLVKAVTAAELLDVLSNAGPFTVFAPTDEAFAKLPAGTLDDLLKPENKAKLQDILQYHVTTSMLRADFFRDGQSLGMANGGKATMTVQDGKVQINGANIVATVPASNGLIHVIDAVLLPQ